MTRNVKPEPGEASGEERPSGRRIRSPNGSNADKRMIRVNLPPHLHRALWDIRLKTNQSIQQIVTDILAEKLGVK